MPQCKVNSDIQYTMKVPEHRDYLHCVAACLYLDTALVTHLHQTPFGTCHQSSNQASTPIMSQEYLNRLLSTPENRVQGECVICLEPYNTMNTTTGVIEAQIKLSCGHTIGSACIVTWLRDNNSCPLCRETFFPRQPRPYLEHGFMDIGRESTGTINATGPFTRQPNAIRPVTVAASSELEPPADSRTRILDAGRQRQTRLPTGPEVPRSSPTGDSSRGRSSTFRAATESEVLTGSDTRSSNVGISNTVRIPTGSVGVSTRAETTRDISVREAEPLVSNLDIPLYPRTEVLTDSFVRRLRDLNRRFPSPGCSAADSVAERLGIMWGEPVSTIVNLAASIAALISVRLRSLDSDYMGAACFYMASHLLHRPKSAQEVAGSTSLSPDLIHRIYELVYAIRTQMIDADNLVLIAGNHLEGMLALLPPPDAENEVTDDEDQWIRRELQTQDTSPRGLLLETLRLWLKIQSSSLGNSSIHCISLQISGSEVLERRLGVRSPRLKVAIGLYMATNLLGLEMSCQRIEDLVGINEYTLRAAYARVHPWADQLLQPVMLKYIYWTSMPRAFEVVPALNWPPLEV